MVIPYFGAASLKQAATDWPRSLFTVSIAERALAEHLHGELGAATTLHFADEGGAEGEVARLGDVRMDGVGRRRHAGLMEPASRRITSSPSSCRDDRDELVADHLVGERYGLVHLGLVVIGRRTWVPPPMPPPAGAVTTHPMSRALRTPNCMAAAGPVSGAWNPIFTCALVSPVNSVSAVPAASSRVVHALRVVISPPVSGCRAFARI